jgi:two-component system NtrC family response regulator
MKPVSVLVIDDEQVICDACQLVLSEQGHAVTLTNTGADGLAAIRQGTYDVVLLDMKLPDIDGMEILNTVLKEKFEVCIIVMTGYSSISNAVEAIKKGASEYLAKPFTDDELLETIGKVCVDTGQQPTT